VPGRPRRLLPCADAGTATIDFVGRDAARPGEHYAGNSDTAETVAQPVTYDNDSYVRDYSRCILCYKCVEACGEVAQNTFAIAVADRGFDARISTGFRRRPARLGVRVLRQLHRRRPTGALMFASEYNLRQAGEWDESRQTVTTTICPYCGVGCNLELHVQDNRIVKVTSPLDHDITYGHL
jgi:NADP-reducing hydrogenase subunit HndD